MKKQHGVTLTGLLLTIAVLAMVTLLGFKLFIPYKQYYTVQNAFKTLSVAPEVRNGGRREFIVAWSKYVMTDDVNVIAGDDVDLTKQGNELIISANYSVRVPLFRNISLMIDFAPTSAAN